MSDNDVFFLTVYIITVIYVVVRIIVDIALYYYRKGKGWQ